MDWEAMYAEGAVPSSIDADVVALADTLEPGTAVDLGCGMGQNCIWLAENGWSVHGVDISPTAIARARDRAAATDASCTFEVADLTSWESSATYDLVISTYALPPAGSGRHHALRTAAKAVASGGTLLIAEFDVSLGERSGWSVKDLATTSEIVEHLGGFSVDTAEVRTTAHAHGHQEEHYPVALVVAHRIVSAATSH